MDNLEDMPPYELCHMLDKLCPPLWFTYSGNGRVDIIHAYRHAARIEEVKRGGFVIDENNPLELVVTRILLQFGGGT